MMDDKYEIIIIIMLIINIGTVRLFNRPGVAGAVLQTALSLDN